MAGPEDSKRAYRPVIWFGVGCALSLVIGGWAPLIVILVLWGASEALARWAYRR